MGLLNDKSVRAAKVDAGEKFIADGNGLYLRVRSGDSSKLWFFRFMLAGKAKKVSIGTFPDLSLADAREKVSGYVSELRKGVDPIQAELDRMQALKAAAELAKAAEESKITVNTLFDRWAAVDLVAHKDGGTYTKDQVRRHILPVIGSMLVTDVRKGHVTAITDKLLAERKNRTAKLAFSLTRQMFRFAVDRDLIEFDPTSALRKARIGTMETERDRFLSDDEIRALSAQLPEAGLTESTELAIWIAFATCCRIGELMQARWEHVDLERRTWWIPPENSKNGRAHTVFLSDFALGHFQRLRDLADESDVMARQKDPTSERCPWVYPNRARNGFVCPKTATKQIGDRQRAGFPPMKGRARVELSGALELSGGRWGPHDLRRTGATIMVSLGVLPEVAERCLNHTEQNRIKRTYQRHTYEEEMREAWRVLGERLELLTGTPANVVILKRPDRLGGMVL